VQLTSFVMQLGNLVWG